METRKITSFEGLTRYDLQTGGFCITGFGECADGSYVKFADVERLLAAPAPAVQAEAVAWMNPETLDVIHDTRKRAWENDFGMGGKAKAAGYTCPLAAPAVQAEDVCNQALEDLLTRIDGAHENYERFGEVCVFEGEPMIHASTLIEIAALRASLRTPSTSKKKD